MLKGFMLKGPCFAERLSTRMHGHFASWILHFDTKHMHIHTNPLKFGEMVWTNRHSL